MKKSIASTCFGVLFLFLLLSSQPINAQDKLSSKAPSECINKGKWRTDKIGQGNQKEYEECTYWLKDEYEENRKYSDMNREQMLTEIKARYNYMIPYFKDMKKGAKPALAKTLQEELNSM